MTNLQVFNQDTANTLFNSNEAFPIAFDDAWQWLEYSRKDSAKRVFETFRFKEGLDVHTIVDSTPPEFGKPRQDIYLSIEGFKRWAMLSNTEVGDTVRDYFLECERVAKQKASVPQSYAQALLEAGRLALELEQSQVALAEAAPKIKFSDKVEACLTLCTLGDYLKAQGWGRTLGFKRLRELGIVMEHGTLPYQKYIQAGYFTIHTNSFGFQSARITGKGQVWLSPKL